MGLNHPGVWMELAQPSRSRPASHLLIPAGLALALPGSPTSSAGPLGAGGLQGLARDCFSFSLDFDLQPRPPSWTRTHTVRCPPDVFTPVPSS